MPQHGFRQAVYAAAAAWLCTWKMLQFEIDVQCPWGCWLAALCEGLLQSTTLTRLLALSFKTAVKEGITEMHQQAGAVVHITN